MMHPNPIPYTHRRWHILFGLSLLIGGLYLAVFSAAAVSRPMQREQTVTSDQVRTVSALPPFTQVVAGDEHTCGLTTGGGVLCWGDNADGQAGDGTAFAYRPPVDVFGLQSGVQALAADGGHTCAILQTGSVVCWGNNRNGQLGDGATGERRLPVPVLGLSATVTAIAAGEAHTCALQAGAVACWGRNTNGQLGNGANSDQKTPVAVTGLAGIATAFSAGANHTCALLETGAIQCWGDNTNGQLGDGTLVSHNVPTTVTGLLSTAIGIATGSDHTCATLTDGRVQCWGDNARGQLGDGSREDRLIPVLVSPLSDKAATVVAGHFHTCVLAVDGDLHCWGSNSRGQLGNGSVESSRIPLRVTGVPGDALGVTAGQDHTCAIFKANTVYCWGSNRARQLGQGAPGVASVPHLVQPAALANGTQPINGIPALVGGRYHTCLLTPSRGAQCWGRNSDGQVGDGSQLPRPQPVNVAGLAGGVAALALGAEHSCSLLQNGSVQCWGSNQGGQLGDGTTTEHFTPSAVSGLTGNTAALVAGDSHTCALVQPGGVKCWGANRAGQLGDGTQSNRTTPVDVFGLATGVVALAAGGAHSCAVLTDGTLRCWGANSSGQLGDGSRSGQLQPVAVSGLPEPVTALTAGVSHTCALLADNRVFCWGGNQTSQLGDGTAEDRLAPVGVSGLGANVLSLHAGGYHTCALVTGNRPLCWGSDSDGQLGAGALTQSTTLLLLQERPPAQLTVNYATAQPGSTLTLIGSGFPYSSTLPLLINGTTISDTLQVNPAGEFILYLTTAGADPGAYQLHVGNPPSAGAFFLLQALAAIRPAEGGGVTLALPTGIGQPVTEIYMPVAGRD